LDIAIRTQPTCWPIKARLSEALLFDFVDKNFLR